MNISLAFENSRWANIWGHIFGGGIVRHCERVQLTVQVSAYIGVWSLKRTSFLIFVIKNNDTFGLVEVEVEVV